jgi:Family of unknown function (DUF5309)
MAAGTIGSNLLTKDQAAKSFSGMIARFMPMGDAPLFAMTSMMKTETALQFQHGYFSKTMIFPSVTLSAQAAAADTLINVTSTANIIPGMLLRPDGAATEVMMVLGVIGQTVIQVQRAVGNTASAIIPISTLCIQVGNANEEASMRPQAVSISTVLQNNYTQIFRNTWAVSGTAAETKMIAGEGNTAESKMDCAALHAADIEKGIIWGQKYLGMRNNQLFHTMDGVLSIVGAQAGANIVTLGATTTFTQLETAIDPVFNVRTDQMIGNERVMFVGGVARRVLNNIFRLNSTYFVQDGVTSYGLQFSTARLTRGVLRIVEHPLLNAFGSTASYAKMAIVVDLASFNLAYLGNRKTKAFDIVGEDGIDAIGGTLTTELTCLVKNPQAFAALYNFTAAAVG